MTAETHAQDASFMWSVRKLPCCPYGLHEYRKVILPLAGLRRFDRILTPTKASVLAEHARLKTKGENLLRHRLS